LNKLHFSLKAGKTHGFEPRSKRFRPDQPEALRQVSLGAHVRTVTEGTTIANMRSSVVGLNGGRPHCARGRVRSIDREVESMLTHRNTTKAVLTTA
jgi:hypothetical protein